MRYCFGDSAGDVVDYFCVDVLWLLIVSRCGDLCSGEVMVARVMDVYLLVVERRAIRRRRVNVDTS